MAKVRRRPPREGRVFLLSPANCSGPRAKMVLSERAQFDLAVRLRGDQGVAIGEVFAFISGLYFKGKLAYALRVRAAAGAGRADRRQRRARDHAECRLASGRDRRHRPTRVRGFAGVDIAANDPRYRRPLVASARALADEIGPTATSCCSAASRRRNTSTS